MDYPLNNNEEEETLLLAINILYNKYKHLISKTITLRISECTDEQEYGYRINNSIIGVTLQTLNVLIDENHKGIYLDFEVASNCNTRAFNNNSNRNNYLPVWLNSFSAHITIEDVKLLLDTPTKFIPHMEIEFMYDGNDGYIEWKPSVRIEELFTISMN
jgi:hypothetical protein